MTRLERRNKKVKYVKKKRRKLFRAGEDARNARAHERAREREREREKERFFFSGKARGCLCRNTREGEERERERERAHTVVKAPEPRIEMAFMTYV